MDPTDPNTQHRYQLYNDPIYLAKYQGTKKKCQPDWKLEVPITDVCSLKKPKDWSRSYCRLDKDTLFENLTYRMRKLRQKELGFI